MTKTGRKEDLFANIAATRPETRQTDLIEPQPPDLPLRDLPAARSNPRASFKPAAKLDTPERLQRALTRERRRMAPFLRAGAGRDLRAAGDPLRAAAAGRTASGRAGAAPLPAGGVPQLGTGRSKKP